MTNLNKTAIAAAVVALSTISSHTDAADQDTGFWGAVDTVYYVDDQAPTNNGHHRCGGNSGQGIGNQCGVDSGSDVDQDDEVHSDGDEDNVSPVQPTSTVESGFDFGNSVNLFVKKGVTSNINIELGAYYDGKRVAVAALTNLHTDDSQAHVGVTAGVLALEGKVHGVVGLYAQGGPVKVSVLDISGTNNTVVTVGFEVNY